MSYLKKFRWLLVLIQQKIDFKRIDINESSKQLHFNTDQISLSKTGFQLPTQYHQTFTLTRITSINPLLLNSTHELFIIQIIWVGLKGGKAF